MVALIDPTDAIDKLMEQTKDMDDEGFLFYIRYQFQLQCVNPGMNFVITNIGE